MEEDVAVDSRELVDRLRRAALASADRPVVARVKLGEPMLPQPELAHLNGHYTLEPDREPLRKVGARRWVLRRFKSVVARVIFLTMREFLENLVRIENKLAARCDFLAEELRTLSASTREEVQLLRDRDDLVLALLEERIARLEEQVLAGQERLGRHS